MIIPNQWTQPSWAPEGLQGADLAAVSQCDSRPGLRALAPGATDWVLGPAQRSQQVLPPSLPTHPGPPLSEFPSVKNKMSMKTVNEWSGHDCSPHAEQTLSSPCRSRRVRSCRRRWCVAGWCRRCPASWACSVRRWWQWWLQQEEQEAPQWSQYPGSWSPAPPRWPGHTVTSKLQHSICCFNPVKNM